MSKTGLAVDAQGNVYVADAGNMRVQKFDSGGKFLMAWGKEGKGDGEFMRPTGVALDTQGNVYVVDDRFERIQKFDSAGKFLGKFGSMGKGDGQFVNPGYLTVDDQGNIYLADFQNGRLEKFDNTGKFLAGWDKCGTRDISGPVGMAVDAQGNIYVTEYGVPVGGSATLKFGNRVCKLDRDGHFLVEWGGAGAGDGQLFRPVDIEVDAEGNVYVADTGNHRIQKFQQSSSPSTMLATAVSTAVPIQSAKDLIGFWKKANRPQPNYYLQFKDDSTWAFLDLSNELTLPVDTSLVGATGVFTLESRTEGNALILQQTWEMPPVECPGKHVMQYQLTGTLESFSLHVIDDDCRASMSVLGGTWNRYVPKPRE